MGKNNKNAYKRLKTGIMAIFYKNSTQGIK